MRSYQRRLDLESSPARRTRVANDHAAALLEFAICCTALMILAAGILDYGLALREHAIMVEAARVGARSASETQSTNASSLANTAFSIARDFLQSEGLDPDDYSYSVRPVALGVGSGIRLAISRPGGYRFLFFVPKGFTSCVTSVFYSESGAAPAGLASGTAPAC